MTVTDESVDVSVESDEDTTAADTQHDDDNDDDEGGRGRKKDRDFTKFREMHQELADFVNLNSGLEPVTPNQVKAILTLRSDFNDTPEQAAKRAEAKRRRDEEAKKYEGLTAEQIKAAKAADRVEKQAEKLEKRLAEAREKARLIREGKEATGEDIAAAVAAAQNGTAEAEPTPQVEAENEDDAPQRRIGRRR